MTPLFASPLACARMRAKWREYPALDIGSTYVVKELLNGGVVRNNNSVSAVPCYVRFIQPMTPRPDDTPLDDYMVEVELVNDSRDVSDEMKWRQEVLEPVQSRLRIWGITYTVIPSDDGNVFIRYKFSDQLNGGDAVCSQSQEA